MVTSIKANNITDTVYTYFDGTRNKYVLTRNELEYIPVNTKESSSGIYSGGTYESSLLTNTDLKKLVSLFKTAEANKAAQTNKNIKPNATVEISNGNKTNLFLLKSAAAINILLNNFLKQLIKNI